MSGETPQHEGEDFVAPDEARLVIDPERAEHMAHDAKANRDKGANYRKQALQSPTSEGKIYANMQAGWEDKKADTKEDKSGWFFDEQKYLEGTSLDFVQRRLLLNQEELNSAENLRDKKDDVQRLKSAIRADQARILELENLQEN